MPALRRNERLRRHGADGAYTDCQQIVSARPMTDGGWLQIEPRSIRVFPDVGLVVRPYYPGVPRVGTQEEEHRCDEREDLPSGHRGGDSGRQRRA